ncbi:acyltransferase [Pseudalkalibacillus decolorationis]|uniref:acyltransferase n=1 Tax=Pseudalkalibacillus decolorationis TaxID=163879 RepID=UPI002147B7E2|nr:acyltransferase [Pseudalkalibacillus decolorationis]
MNKKLGQSKNQFFEEIHFLRAFACVGVLLVHLSASYFYQHNETYNWLTFFLNQIGRFGTPTFALISGFLLFQQVKSKGFDQFHFVQSRFTKIVMPFIVWSVFYLLVKVFFLNVEIHVNSDFVMSFLFGETFYHLYFMVIVIQFYILFPLLQLIRSNLSWIIALVSSFVISVIFTNLSSFISVTEGIGALLNNRVFFFTWIFYFIFGGFLSYNWNVIMGLAKKQGLMIISLFTIYVLAVYEYKTLGSIPSNRMSNLINIPLLTIAVIGLFPLIKKIPLFYESFKIIGTLSMGIYLVHPLVLLVLQNILPRSFWTTYGFPLMFMVVLLLSIGIVQVLRRLSIVQYIIPVPRMQSSNKPVRV